MLEITLLSPFLDVNGVFIESKQKCLNFISNQMKTNRQRRPDQILRGLISKLLRALININFLSLRHWLLQDYL